MAVAIVPSLLVAVLPARRNQLIEDAGKILLQSRFKFDRADGGGAPHIENVGESSLDSRRIHDPCNLLGEIVHVPVALGSDHNLILVAHAAAPIHSNLVLAKRQYTRLIDSLIGGRPRQHSTRIVNDMGG